jgi:ribokinase
MDLVVHTRRLPVPGATVLGGRFHTVRGGKGANQAVACARLGAETWLVGRVGGDVFGAQLRQGLEADGVRCDYLRCDVTEPSGVALIVVDETGDNMIVVAPGANMKVTAEEAAVAVRALAPQAVLCQLEVPLPAVVAAFEAARAQGALTVLDAGPPQPLPAALLAQTDVLSPNETEARAILGMQADARLQPEEAAQRLLELGPGRVVLKLGAAGALVAGPEGIHHVPAFPAQVVDTTGAGDAFTAALAVSLAEGSDAVTATRTAAAAGALAVTVFGAAPSMPTRQRLEAFLREQTT